jgi:hypothetical protein
VTYDTSYAPRAAELEPAEGEALSAAIHRRLDGLQRCYDALEPRLNGLAWQGRARIVAHDAPGPHQVELRGSGDPGVESCVRREAAGWTLRPSELGPDRAAEIPLRLTPARE